MSWTVGVYRREGLWWSQSHGGQRFITRFETFADPVKAWKRYLGENNNSCKVIICGPHNDDACGQPTVLQRCSTAEWDKEGMGVATLLHERSAFNEKHRNNSVVDPLTIQNVREALADGRLPFVPPDRSEIKQTSLKGVMKVLFQRASVEYFACSPYKKETLHYFDSRHHPRVKGHVALTIDDSPCRFGQQSLSELPRVLDILKEYNFKATFMTVGSWCSSETHQSDLIRLIREGHEMGNHGMMDRSYKLDNAQQFLESVKQCNQIIQDLRQSAGVDDGQNKRVRWFRAPHGQFTQTMAEQLRTLRMTNVMCDTYASCPIVQDGIFIAEHLTKTCQDGSVILIHMPEKPFRHWCWDGLVELLKGLQDRNLKAVTVSELVQLAGWSPPNEMES